MGLPNRVCSIRILGCRRLYPWNCYPTGSILSCPLFVQRNSVILPIQLLVHRSCSCSIRYYRSNLLRRCSTVRVVEPYLSPTHILEFYLYCYNRETYVSVFHSISIFLPFAQMTAMELTLCPSLYSCESLLLDGVYFHCLVSS
jgi:hypothetical protein